MLLKCYRGQSCAEIAQAGAGPNVIRWTIPISNERSVYIEKLSENPALRDIPKSQLQNPEFLIRLTLDASAVLEESSARRRSY